MPKTKRRTPKKSATLVESFTIYQPVESPGFWAIGHRYGNPIHKQNEGPDVLLKGFDDGVYESAADATRALLGILEHSELEVDDG